MVAHKCFSLLCGWDVQNTTNVNPPSREESIPVVNLRMEFNMDLSIFTYQLAQQVAQVVLAGVSNASNMDATIYTEPGDSTPFSQFICITAKFYDADYGANYQLYSVGATLVRHFECFLAVDVKARRPWKADVSWLASEAPLPSSRRSSQICAGGH